MTYFKKIGICLIAVLGLLASPHGSTKAPGDWFADANGCKVWRENDHSGNGFTWSGACEQGYVNGVGILQWYKDGKPAEKYEGSYKAGLREGKGSYLDIFGGRYEGEWHDDIRSGKGSYTWADRKRYEGDWVNGFRHGTGILIWADGRYEGDFKSSRITGKGVYSFTDGSRYEGSLKNGLRHGVGIDSYSPSGGPSADNQKFAEKVGSSYVIRAIYEGDKPIIGCNKQTLEQCEWWDQNRVRIANEKGAGECTKYFESLRDAVSLSGGLAKTENEACYENGVKNGKGTLYWFSGSRYEGRLENGARRGAGSLILPRGSSSIAGWDRKKEGQWIGENYVIRAVFASDGEVLYDCRNNTIEQCDWFGVNREDHRQNLFAAEKSGACKQVTALFNEARTRSGSLFADYMDERQSMSRCEENARFNGLVASKAARPMYLGAVAYEDKSERSRAKTLYRELMSRFPNSNEALLAGQRLSQLGDVEAMETSAANAARASYQAAESMKSQNYDQCVANRNACYNRCSPLKGSAQIKCEQGCAVCTR